MSRHALIGEDGLVRHRDGLAEAKRLRLPGCCVFCEAPITRKNGVTCGAETCSVAYYRSWHRDQALRTPERYISRKRARASTPDTENSK